MRTVRGRELPQVRLGGLFPFVHRSFVTPDIFRVRVVMVPRRARFAVVPIAFCSGFVARLNETLNFEGRGISVVGTKHISSPLERDNAWLHVTAHRAAVESPELLTLSDENSGEIRHFPKSR